MPQPLPHCTIGSSMAYSQSTAIHRKSPTMQCAGAAWHGWRIGRCLDFSWERWAAARGGKGWSWLAAHNKSERAIAEYAAATLPTQQGLRGSIYFGLRHCFGKAEGGDGIGCRGCTVLRHQGGCLQWKRWSAWHIQRPPMGRGRGGIQSNGNAAGESLAVAREPQSPEVKPTPKGTRSLPQETAMPLLPVQNPFL